MTDYDAYEYLIWAEYEARKRLNPQRFDYSNPEWYIETAQDAFWVDQED